MSLSSATAKRLVEKIAKDHGFLGEDVLREMSPEVRKQVEDALLKKDEMIGSSAVTLAKNLYTSNARFIFELLQNADDNHYTKARARGETPYVAFSMSPGYIIIDCNEDGFTEENLVAICNIGKSSKSGAQGYIGEKGIGFKSVFMAAYKVHIQSGDFSFSFQHRPGESGMGMISPIWEDAVDCPPAGVTRMKLFLHGEKSVGHQAIRQQFQEIQDTYLLFLKNIQRIRISFLDESGEVSTSRRVSIQPSSSAGHQVSLLTMQSGGSEQTTKYHVTRHIATGLSMNENRSYSETDERTRAWSSSEVVLAFPISADGSTPVVETQQIFAYLPIRNMGFKADFVTQANRQDIVTTSDRNITLLDGIADAFVKAVKQLCDDKSLQFTWMRYLPHKGDFPWEGYWKSLIERIKEKLADVPLLRSLSGDTHGSINQMRLLPSSNKLDGTPIFDDIQPERYLSNGYLERDLKMLREYGLLYLNMNEFLDRVSADLRRPTSRMKSILATDSWHTAAAKVLLWPFEQGWTNQIDTLKTLELIPLRSGTWTSVKSRQTRSRGAAELWFPTVGGGIEIPADLLDGLVHLHAASNDARRKLFVALGVVHMTAGRVRKLIFDKYPAVVNPRFLFGSSSKPEEISLAHLTFLYRTHDTSSPQIAEYRRIAVLTEDGSLKTPNSQDVYVIDDQRYGARNILKKVDGSETAEDAPGFAVPFLLPRYLDGPLGQRDDKTSQSWVTWLQSTLGIRTRLRLITGSVKTKDHSITDLFQYILDHRTDDLVGVLHHYWDDIRVDVTENEKIATEISESFVICRGGIDFTLSETYLPSSELINSCSQYLTDADSFPFLELDGNLTPAGLNIWDFLHTAFHVGKTDDLAFYLQVLKIMEEQSESYSFEDTSVQTKVYQLYKKVHARVIDSQDEHEARLLAQLAFEYRDLILINPSPSGPVVWTDSRTCRWDAPPNMLRFHSLGYHYELVFAGDAELGDTLKSFFRNTLRIPDLSWRDIVEELRCRKGDDPDPGIVIKMYERLDDMISEISRTDKHEIRQAFNQEPLIYASGSWHKVPDCLWSSATGIPGKVTLNNEYPDQQSFFVKFLGVPTLTLKMVYDELKRKGSSESTSASVDEIKEDLWQFNSLLQTNQKASDIDPVPIRDGRLFPVKLPPDGDVQLVPASSTDFAIVDRNTLGAAFETQARLLDFDLDEVRRLQPFLQWAGLTERCLSVKVKEITAPVSESDGSIRESQHSIRARAYALCRLAKHFNSPRTRPDATALYELLRRSTALETNGISSELHLVEDSRTIRVQKSQTDLHIEKSEDRLKVYMPRDARRQDYCFSSKLPEALFQWMMDDEVKLVSTTQTETAKRLISSVFVAKVESLEYILREEGITELEFPDENASFSASSSDPTMSSRGQTLSPDQETRSNHEDRTDRSARHTPASEAHAPSVSAFSGNSSTLPEEEEEEVPHLRPARTTGPRPITPPQSNNPSPSAQSPYSPAARSREEIVSSAKYLNLLQRVIQAARHAGLPYKGIIDRSSVREALPQVNIEDDANNAYFAFRSTSQIERDKMIGAAGELYVFELLYHLTPRLPNFSREMNWPSTIRRYVTVHHEYADMAPWNGRETADIVYPDLNGTLTTALIGAGYFDGSVWSGRRPTYYIEVKTTTGPCETPFFMSKAQYRRVCDIYFLSFVYLGAFKTPPGSLRLMYKNR